MGEKSKSGETEEVARTGACEKHGLAQWGPLRGLKGGEGGPAQNVTLDVVVVVTSM